MGYRDEFIERSKKVFEKQVKLNRAQHQAYELIDNYFKHIFSALKEEEKISGREFTFENRRDSWYISLKGASLKVIFKGNEINVEIMPLGAGYHDYLVLQDYNYVSKKFDRNLDEELLNYYLKEAFDSVFNYY